MSGLARRTLPAVVLFTISACSASPPLASGVGGAASSTSSSATMSDGASAAAARAFVAALPDSTRGDALRPFADADRSRWFFIPTEIVPTGRRGLTIQRMAPPARDAAFRLLGTALSADGYRTARAILDNEPFLRELETAAGTLRFARHAEHYFVSVFDTAAGAAPWGWRFEGHHLSVNVTGTGAQGPVVVAPLFMGANPHRVPSGPRAGSRLLAAEEDVARALLASFTADQRTRAIVADSTYGDIRTRNDPKAAILPQEGVAAGEMTSTQQSLLRQLLGVYAGRMAPANARSQLQRIEAAGFNRLRFVWAGSTVVGKAHYYRIHGPTVLVEYDNTQNTANHSHTVWRDLENDFGGDMLRDHYQRNRH